MKCRPAGRGRSQGSTVAFVHPDSGYISYAEEGGQPTLATSAALSTKATIRDLGPTTPTLFHEPWWLNIVGRGSYEEAQVINDGRVIGRLPYLLTRRHFSRVSVMPQLTHVLGPAIDEGKGSINTRMLRRLDVMKDLAGQLPRLAHFRQVCHHDVGDVLAFQGCGYDASVHFSLELAPAPEAQLWAAMRDKTRNVVRRSLERSAVEELIDPQEFSRFYQRNLGLAGAHSYFDLGLIAPLFDACRRRDCGRMLAVRDATGDLGAAVFYIWDRSRLWYFMSTRDRGSKDNGAVSLLLWHAIREAAGRGLTFDFDGVSSEGSSRFYAGFGAAISPRYAIHRSSAVYRLADNLKALLRPGNRNHFTG